MAAKEILLVLGGVLGGTALTKGVQWVRGSSPRVDLDEYETAVGEDGLKYVLLGQPEEVHLNKRGEEIPMRGDMKPNAAATPAVRAVDLVDYLSEESEKKREDMEVILYDEYN